MTSILLTGPAIEPISLEETKTFLRVEHDDEDQLIAALIAGARSHIEAQTQTTLMPGLALGTRAHNCAASPSVNSPQKY